MRAVATSAGALPDAGPSQRYAAPASVSSPDVPSWIAEAKSVRPSPSLSSNATSAPSPSNSNSDVQYPVASSRIGRDPTPPPGTRYTAPVVPASDEMPGAPTTMSSNPSPST